MAKNRRSSLAGSKWSALRITLHADFRIVSPQRARVFILYFFMIQLAALRWILCTNTHTHARKRVCVLPATRTGRILNLINLKRLRRRCILLLGLALPPCCCCCCFCFRWRCDAIRLAQRKIWKKNKIKFEIANEKSKSGSAGSRDSFQHNFHAAYAQCGGHLLHDIAAVAGVATTKMQSMLEAWAWGRISRTHWPS